MKIRAYKNWVIFAKIRWVSLLISLALILATMFVLVPFIRELIMAEKRIAISSLVQEATSVIASYQKQVDDGTLTNENAKKQAAERIAAIRYNVREYIWINDLTPRMVMHPIRPELNGQSLSEFKDSNGKHLFMEMVKICKVKGNGFVKYSWEKPGSSKPFPKLSYVEIYQPWGWIVGTGIYIDDVDTQMKKIVAGIVVVLGILILVVQVISKRKQQDALIHRLSTAIEQSANTVVITDRNAVIQYANPSFNQTTGYSMEETLGKNQSVLKSGIHPPEHYEAVWQTILAGNTWRGVFCNKHKDGSLFWESTVITPIFEKQEITHFVAIKEDITLRKKHEELLYHQANYDDLTGLPNCNLLKIRIGEAVANQPACRKNWALMLLDLDNFKVINGTFGHSLGDSLLVAVAERLTACLEPGDMIARLGSDVFVIAPFHICNESGHQIHFAQHIMASFSEPFILKEQEFFITASMGIAVYPKDGEEMDTLLRNADAAMCCAKSKARNSFELYNKEINIKLNEQMVMETMLRHALERDEFQVYYQPKQELATGMVTSFEALLRWQPRGGPMVFPDDFIPLLEATGLIVPVGEWVLREVCHQVKLWNETGVIIKHASVNVSFQQFKRPDIVARIQNIVEKAGISPSLICLELTESIMMDEREETLIKMHSLNAAGFSISIDDFGTGYSSLSYLRQMPIHELKIDKSFVMTLPDENTTLVNTIIDMAHSFGLRVVAEGVETEEQKSYLISRGCQAMQGYLLNRPLPLEPFERFMRMHNAPVLEADVSHDAITNEAVS